MFGCTSIFTKDSLVKSLGQYNQQELSWQWKDYWTCRAWKVINGNK